MPRLPISTKRPPSAIARETGLNEIAGKGVEHDVDAATRSDPKHIVREVCRTRVKHVFNADIVQQFTLGRRTCRGEDARASTLRDLYSSQTDTTCRRMDRTDSPFDRRATWSRQNDAVRKAIGKVAASSAETLTGPALYELGTRNDVRGERATGNRHHGITGRDVRDAGSDLQHTT